MDKIEHKKYPGLTDEQVEKNKEQYGTNALTQIPPDPLWKKILEGFADPMIIILCVALAIQMLLFFIGKAEWYEPVGVLIAIIIANGISSISDSRQEKKAIALKKEEALREMTKVIRNGKKDEIRVMDVVKNDIIFLQAGDKIPADGILLSGDIKVDLAALNGESDEAEKVCCDKDTVFVFHEKDPEKLDDKTRDKKVLRLFQNGEFVSETRIPASEYKEKEEEIRREYEEKEYGFCDTSALDNANFVHRGTVVCDEEAYMIANVIGDKTLFGIMALEMQEETRKTPLQVKLAKLAKQISMFGYIGAICIVLGIICRTLLTGSAPGTFVDWVRLIIDASAVAVTIIVCAVPEGLPSLTSMLLAFQSIKMAKDNVLVKKIRGLESAGSVSILFLDKTGTVTEGKLSVDEIALGNASSKFKKLSDIKAQELSKDIVTGIGVNNSSTSSSGKIIGGNSTDRALMSFLVAESAADAIDKDSAVKFNAFDSNKKMSSVVVNDRGNMVTYVKGQPEKLIERCSTYVDENGAVKQLDKNALNKYIEAQANRMMRMLVVAKREGDSDEGELTLVCVLSIRDNIRKEAVDALSTIKKAGIQAVMVTGDRKETAVAIAKETGLISEDTDMVITSSELEAMSDDEIKKILPNIRVVSRALPTDKSNLVRLAQEMNLVVGMTGDGVNDAPALKKADVGFAMGSGTEVAKEAGDMVILDDSLMSISKAILYGRTIFKSLRKFLIFQLTVNVAAVLICFLGALLGENVVLTVTQLLTVNLAMDVLAAIAFGSEPALKEYMLDKPVPRDESIVTKKMMGEILVIAFYITGLCLSILFVPAVRNLFGDVDTAYLKSALYATFMMAITFNGFNARTEHLNLLKDIGKNKSFLAVMASIFALQYVFVTFGGEVLSVERLAHHTWGICILLAFLVIPIDLIRKAIVGNR